MNKVLKEWFEFISKQGEFNQHIITVNSRQDVTDNLLKPLTTHYKNLRFNFNNGKIKLNLPDLEFEVRIITSNDVGFHKLYGIRVCSALVCDQALYSKSFNKRLDDRIHIAGGKKFNIG